PLPLPRAINSGVPEAVERVLLKALAKERRDRYAAASDLTKAFVEAWLAAGVPMKGTGITLAGPAAQVLGAPGPTVEGEAEPPKMDAPIPAVAPEAAGAPAAKPVKPKRKIPRWILVGGGILLFLCCVFVFLATRNNRNNRGQDAATAQATAVTLAPAATATSDAPLPPRDTGRLLDDFEGTPPVGSSGWEGFVDEATDSAIVCAANTDAAHSGANSLLFEFDVAAKSWATCGFYFRNPQNWSAAKGVSFYLRADRAGLPFHVDVYGGSPGALDTYYYAGQTPPESVDNWTLIEIHWDEIRRAEWQDPA
ncbi:MAG: carbohydrate binding domain-containing protein, partial [Chloroflexota bacterium]